VWDIKDEREISRVETICKLLGKDRITSEWIMES
jgi:hypothetical protein